MDIPQNTAPRDRSRKDKIHMNNIIRIPPGSTGFAEDKDQARQLRTSLILPLLEKGRQIILDFNGVQYATQSYIHALVGEALQKYGGRALDLIEFKDCSAPVRSVIELVVDYSLGGFPDQYAV